MQADIRWGVRRHRLASVRHPCRGRIRHRARRLFTARWCEARARLPGDAPAGRIVCGRRLCDDTSVLTLPYLPAYSIIMIALHKVAAPRLDRTAKAADEVAAYERIDSTHAKAADSSSGGGSRATMTAASPSPWSPPVPWTTPEDGSAGRGHAFPGTRSPYRSS